MNNEGTSCTLITNIGRQFDSYSQPIVYQRDTKPIGQNKKHTDTKRSVQDSLIEGAQIQIQIQKEAHRYKEISTGSLI